MYLPRSISPALYLPLDQGSCDIEDNNGQQRLDMALDSLVLDVSRPMGTAGNALRSTVVGRGCR